MLPFDNIPLNSLKGYGTMKIDFLNYFFQTQHQIAYKKNVFLLCSVGLAKKNTLIDKICIEMIFYFSFYLFKWLYMRPL